MAIVKGYTFGSTELVTNTKLHNIVDNASISGFISPSNLNYIVTISTNASVPNVSTGTIFKLYSSTYSSIASFTGMVTGHKFTIMAQQASFPAILDAGNFILASNWIPAKANDNLTLVWDGTNFIEVGRVVV